MGIIPCIERSHALRDQGLCLGLEAGSPGGDMQSMFLIHFPFHSLSKDNKSLFYIYNKNKILATVWVMDWKMARQKMWEDQLRGSWINLREGWYWLDLVGSRRAEVRRKLWGLRGDRSCSPIPKGSQRWPKKVQICPSALKGLHNLISFPLNSYFSPSQKIPL